VTVFDSVCFHVLINYAVSVTVINGAVLLERIKHFAVNCV